MQTEVSRHQAAKQRLFRALLEPAALTPREPSMQLGVAREILSEADLLKPHGGSTASPSPPAVHALHFTSCIPFPLVQQRRDHPPKPETAKSALKVRDAAVQPVRQLGEGEVSTAAPAIPRLYASRQSSLLLPDAVIDSSPREHLTICELDD
jgi:hypothetical protein